MEKTNKRRVFITGANGFIGANLTRRCLDENFEVHILHRTNNPSWRLKNIWDKLIIHTGDITSFPAVNKALKKSQPHYIIHLATYGAYHYQTEMTQIIKVNIEGTKNLLEASKDITYKCFINTGSSSEYGFKDTPMKENSVCNPTSYYAASKLTATHLCKIFSELHNKPIVTFRLFSIYGPYEEPTRFIPTIMKTLITNQEIKLTPGDQRRDFTYIDDVSDAYLRALTLETKVQGKICNIGTGKEYTNDEVVQKLFAVTNSQTTIKKGGYPKREWDTAHWKADISYTKKLLTWNPKYSLEQGLKQTYSWFYNNLQLYTK